MAFPQQTPRVFNLANVEALHPNQIGVFGLFRTGVWIYIGSGDIRQGLLEILNGSKPCVLAEHPTHWVDETTIDPIGRQRQLLNEFPPRCAP